MKNEKRIVLDTNVLISSLLISNSLTRRVFDKTLTNGKLLISLATYAEVSEVLSRPKFRRYVTETERLQFLAKLINVAHPVEISQKIQACRDPKDDKFLEVALCGNADLIITGDQDLLVLHPFQGISIVTPHSYLSEETK